MSILLDGTVEADETISLDPSANLWRGQGWFETMAVKDATVYNLESHVDRLTETLPDQAVESTDWDRLQTKIGQLVQSEERAEGRLKLVVWEEDDGYRNAGWVKPYDPLTPKEYWDGISLDVQLRSHPPRWPLSHEKRTSYASVMHQRRECPDWDVLYCDLEGDVWETGVANILWYEAGTICSPRMDGHWLPGTILEAIFGRAENLGIDTAYRNAGWDELGSFCWVTNSLIGMVPVQSIATEQYDPTPPPEWMELRDRLLSDKVFPRWHEESLFE